MKTWEYILEYAKFKSEKEYPTETCDSFELGVLEIIKDSKGEKPKIRTIRSDEDILIKIKTKRPLTKEQSNSLKPFYVVYEKIKL